MAIRSWLESLYLFLAASALWAQADGMTARVAQPAYGASTQASGWSVDPARGALHVTIPVGQVPGEVPIPVVFRMNGTATVEQAMASGGTGTLASGISCTTMRAVCFARPIPRPEARVSPTSMP